MLMHSGAEYVATASTSHPQDLERKIKAACDRLAFIQILTPCNPSWGYDDHKGVEVSRLPWNPGCGPCMEGRRIRPAERKSTVRDYTSSQRRYAHLSEDDLQLVRDSIPLGKLQKGFSG